MTPVLVVDALADAVFFGLSLAAVRLHRAARQAAAAAREHPGRRTALRNEPEGVNTASCRRS
ncbi:hypothetical protein ACFYRN_40145 [Streptomyces sp. NPDC005227]|uniref:hypothetical protein n=1 Tax=unclassified Streptomyces TaxID=2593676 RepID=UPI0036956885